LHFSLVVVGAHEGMMEADLIKRSCATGRVLLIEPVPFLFARLRERYSSKPNVVMRDFAISMADGTATFMAPKLSAGSVTAWGTEVGSLNPTHATDHNKAFQEHVEAITVETRSFRTLIAVEGITSIDNLFVDAEGLDADLLLNFPTVLRGRPAA
jgi:FkbM family methyltransferase